MLTENSDTLINIFDQIYQQYPGWRIYLTGSGSLFQEFLNTIVTIAGGEVVTSPQQLTDDSDVENWKALCLLQALVMQGHLQLNKVQRVQPINDFINSLSMIIVGRENFDPYFLKYVLPFACRNPYLIVISQEDFINHITDYDTCGDFDDWIPYQRYDPRIQDHPGLSYLASIGFEWPEYKWRAKSEPSKYANIENWNTKSRLSEQFGYSAASDISIEARRNSLAMAVYVMGLQEVAEFLVNFLINKLQNNPSHAEAVERRREDAEWLKKTYYDNSIHRFVWPNYY